MDPAVIQNYTEKILKWRENLDESLRAENGWLALAGLFWLEEGEHSLVRTSNGGLQVANTTDAGWLATFTRQGDDVSFNPNPALQLCINGKAVTKSVLCGDTDPDPDFIEYEDLCMVLINRGPRIGLRVWDNSRPERTSFPKRRWYPVNGDYHLEGEMRSVDPARTITFPNILGDSTEETVLGEICFDLAGNSMRLLALEASENRAFVIFGDLTNGRTTYPSGRYLIIEPDVSDKWVLDFNKAYNPPCAFTPYATCTLPPDANRLAIEIPVGERYFQPA